jgi:hypothetical protein
MIHTGLWAVPLFKTNNQRKSMTPEITIPVAELKQALPGLSKLVSKSRTLPVLQSVRVQRDVQGNVSIESTDLDAHVTYRLKDTQPGEPAEVLVPLDALTRTAKGSSETLVVIPDGKDKVRLRYHIGNSPVEQRISVVETKDWPLKPTITSPAVPLGPQFGPTLKEALQCASEESNRPVLHGAHVDVSDKQAHYIVGTNGRVLYAANSFCFDLKQSVTIPNLKILGWNGLFAAEGCTLAVTNEPTQETQWLQLQSGPWTVTARQVAGVFPNWRNAIPAQVIAKGTNLKLSPAAIEQMLRAIPQLPGEDGDNSGVRLRMDGQLFIESRHRDTKEWTSITVPEATITGDPVTVCLNRHYLAQALRYGLADVHIEDELSPLVFSQGGRRFVVVPLHPDGPTKKQPAKVEAATPPPPVTPSTPAPAATATETSTQAERKVVTKESKETKPEPQEPLKLALDRIESLRETLKNTLRDIGEVMDAVKAAEREKKTSFKEVESVRATLRSLQKVAI